MKRIRLLWLNGLLLIPLAISSAVPEGPTASLSAQGQKIIDYLVEDWNGKFHSTTIPHAMENLGLPVDDGLRLEIIAHLRANPKLSRNLRFWGANNFLLTNNERRMAKLLLNAWRDSQDLPTLKSASKTLGLTEKEVAAMLAFMAESGFLAADGDSGLGYSLAEDAALWGGPLRHNYHTIHVAGEDKFDVW